MRGILILGVVLAILGLIGLAIPVFTTTQTKEVAKLGDVQIQSREQSSHTIPPLLSGGVLVLGIVLIGAGTWSRR
jgi:uncharacterized membrane protein HdeD (DUF308 family)